MSIGILIGILYLTFFGKVVILSGFLAILFLMVCNMLFAYFILIYEDSGSEPFTSVITPLLGWMIFLSKKIEFEHGSYYSIRFGDRILTYKLKWFYLLRVSSLKFGDVDTFKESLRFDVDDYLRRCDRIKDKKLADKDNKKTATDGFKHWDGYMDKKVRRNKKIGKIL